MFKLAVIRDSEEAQCPFGLPISQACRSVGEAIDKMQLIDIDADAKENRPIIERNLTTWSNNAAVPQRCAYAAHLFKTKPHYVDCNYGEADAGISQNVSFLGSPYYSQIGEGFGPGGLFNFPVTYHTDGSEYRNLYYGMMGWASKRHFRSILRQGLLEVLRNRKS